MTFLVQREPTPEYAARMDSSDPLSGMRSRFYIPKTADGAVSIYSTGNSLGLQPRTAKTYIEEELDDWATLGVEGHMHARHPWLAYHEFVAAPLARVVGAMPDEVVAMNSLTVNLHLMLVSFYRPTADRYKIVIEKGAFPSDQYAVESQLHLHGRDPRTDLIELAPRGRVDPAHGRYTRCDRAGWR